MTTTHNSNEDVRASQFNAALDNMLAGEPSPHMLNDEDAALLALSASLARIDASGDNHEGARLRERLVGRAVTRRAQSGRLARHALGAVAAVAIGTAAIISVPPLRALAQTVLEQIGLIQFTDETTFAQQRVGEMADIEIDPDVTYFSDRLSVEEASQLSGMRVYAPTFLPESFEFAYRNVGTNERGVWVGTDFHQVPGRPDESDDMISLTQSRHSDNTEADPITWPIGDAQPIEVTINGNRGVFVGDAPTGTRAIDDGPWELLTVNTLAWEQDGYTFIMQNFELDFEQMRQVAESLAAP